jgi:hexosaminidase
MLARLLILSLLAIVAPPGAAVIPQPASVVQLPGALYLPLPVAIAVADPALGGEAALLQAYLEQLGIPAGQGETKDLPGVRLALDPSLAAGAYRLVIDAQGIGLDGANAAAVLNGAQTLRQLLFHAEATGEGLVVPAQRIEDRPRFGYRGMHLDVSRHFFDLAFIKRYLDLMALHRMNVFHWHLTDDQGWRLESRAFPRLTQVGATRAGTVRGHTHDAGAVSDGKPHGGYYTWEQVREVVAYAAARHITVIPEIDVPGHASAMLAAYPELGCTGRAPKVQTHFGIFPEILCPTETTFTFLETLFAEVAALFPGPYIHIGGDEVREDQWRECAECTAIMQREGLADYAALRGWFVNRTERIVNRLGKRIIGWDEILDGDVRPSATVMSWRGTEGGIAAARAGHDVIMTPLQHVYFDFYQSHAVDEPPAIHGLTRLRDVYRFNPVPDTLLPAQRQHILGAQGNLWTEYVPDAAIAERMVLPRMSALAEVLWTPQEARDFDDFAVRLAGFERFLEAQGYRPADAHYKPHLQAEPGADGGFTVSIDSLSSDLRYTTDGTAPGRNSTTYKGPFNIKGNTTIHAVAVRPDGSLLGDARLSLVDHLGRRARTYAGQHEGEGEGDFAAVLVDGRIGSDRIFAYPLWQSFAGEGGADIVFHWEQPQRVRMLDIGMEAGYHRRMYRPTTITVERADAEGNWVLVTEVEAAAIEDAGKRFAVTFEPVQLTRLRLRLANNRRVWSEEQGGEIAPPLRLDEVIIR